MQKDGNLFIWRLLSFLLVIGFLFNSCTRSSSVDKLLDEFDSTLTEYLALASEQGQSGLEPAKMVRLVKLREEIDKLSTRIGKLNSNSFTEEQIVKLFTIMEKISQLR